MSATGGASGNPVIFSIDPFSDFGACSLAGPTVSFTATGHCIIDADQAGNEDYSAAPQVQQSFWIGPASQSISFTSSSVVYGQADFSPASSSSGLQVSYSDPTGQCAIDAERLVRLTGAGSCKITAGQAGDSDYRAASPVTQTFTIAKAPLLVNANDASVMFGRTPTLSYTLAGFVNGDTTADSKITGKGACSATPPSPNAGSYPGAINCAPGTLAAPNYQFFQNLAATLTITQASQSISFPSTPVTYGRAPFSPAKASSGLAVIYSAPSGACAVNAAGLVTITGAGSCTVTASQPGNLNFAAAQPVTQTFTVNPAILLVRASSTKISYGQTPKLQYTLLGFVNGDTAVSANVTGTGACLVAAGTPSDVGTYPNAITCTPNTLSAPNYRFAAGAGATLTITRASQSIRFTSSVSNPTVGGTYVPTATGGASGQPVVFSIGVSSVGCSISGTTVTFTAVGVCEIDANQAGTNNYFAAKTVQQSLVITAPADCSSSSIGATPLNDLGQGTYRGYEGGLYPGGSNNAPSDYLSEGLAASARVRPLSADGTPSPSGRIVLMSVGMSNTRQEFLQFMDDYAGDFMKSGNENIGGTLNSNPQVELVNGATGTWDAKKIVRYQSEYIGILDSDLAVSGVTADQVQAVWIKEAIGAESSPFPTDAKNLQSSLNTIIAMLTSNFPNLRLVYLSSRVYAGYTVGSLSTEPFAYEGGFAVQWTVAQKIFSDPTALPYVAWGPYLWADGTVPRSDGLTWLCSDFQSDGAHPSTQGAEKVAGMLQNFFSTDPTTDTWFDAPVPQAPTVKLEPSLSRRIDRRPWVVRGPPRAETAQGGPTANQARPS